MTHLRDNYLNILEEGIRKVLMDILPRRPIEYPTVYNVKSSRKRLETDTKIGGFPIAQEVTEGQAIPFVDAEQGGTQTYLHKGYALGFRTSKWLEMDDLYAVIGKFPSKLATSIIQTIEQQSVALWDDAFAGATFTGLDGSALCSTTHTRIDGGNATNRLAVDADLTKTSLQNLWTIMENTVDENGHPLLLRANKVVVHVDNRFNIAELLQSAQIPNSQDNNFNSLRNLDLQPFVYHYLGDSDAWFLQAEEHEVNFFWREQPVFESDRDFGTSTNRHKAEMRFINGFTDFRGVAGTPGA